jgi:DNA-binding transcriptional LysR family regulator
LFLAVMECSSITGAAKRVSLSPGAISLQLHNLGADLRT